MISSFREKVTRSLSSESQLRDALSGMTAADWEPLAELFAAQLPEFDGVYALPGAEELAAQVAQIRGVQALTASDLPSGSGEVVVFTAQLQEGQDVQQAMTAAQAAGWTVLLVAAALEYTSRGGRTLLSERNIPVRAVVQLADTPGGLVFERRTSGRWAS